MGTRGCVAVGTLEKWTGVYNHYDSYPTELGKNVWARLQEARLHSCVRAFADTLLTYDDWNQVKTEGICVYCGKRTGEPHSIRGDLYAKTRSLQPGEYPDPEVQLHSHHTPETFKNQLLTSEYKDPGHIRWVYIIDANADTLHVLHAKDGAYSHIDTLALDGEEPCWEDLQEDRRSQRSLKHPLAAAISRFEDEVGD